jgi:Autotransporter beta-domain
MEAPAVQADPAVMASVPGAGGAGVVGSNLTVINSGTIGGGLANGGAGAQANAITFTGGTNVLELQAGSTLIGNVVAFSAADTFRLGGTADASFNVANIGPMAQYQGFGSYVKTGSSTWSLTGTTTAAMPWIINGGTLEVDGSIADPTVNSGGTLAGTGTVGATQVNAGGVLAPGNGTAGTSLTIAGNLAFQAGGIYLVQVSLTTASSANVTGTATLGGATVSAIFANGSFMSRQYTILTASGGVSGTFASSIANTNLARNFSDTLSYDATHAYLNLTLGYATQNSLSANQQAVANTLIRFFDSTGGIPMAFGALTPAGLTQASGEVGTGSQQTTFNAMGQFMGLMTDPFVAGRGDGPSAGGGATGYADEASAYAGRRKPNDALAAIYIKSPVQTFEARWSTWIAGYGGSRTTSGNAVLGSNSTTSSIYGTAVGADYRFSADTIAGFSLAGGGTNFNVVGSGYGRSDLFQAGAFIRHTVGAAYISGALAYGWQDITTDRIVTAAGADHLRAKFNANAFSGRLEGGYRYVTPIRRRHRNHTLRGGPVHDLRSAILCGERLVGGEYFRARLWRQRRHRYPQRIWLPHRQILCHTDCDPHLAQPLRLGA